jgi:hypothetical protein
VEVAEDLVAGRDVEDGEHQGNGSNAVVSGR